MKNGTGSTVDCIDHRHSLYIHPTQWRDQSYPRLQGALAFQEDRSRGRVRPSLGDPQNAPRRGRGGRVSYVIRRTRRGEAPWRGRRVESACSTGTSRRQLRFNTPLQSQLVDPTQRLERKSSKSVVGRPFVKKSANCLALGIWRTQSSPIATFSRTKWMSISMCFVRW